MKVKYLKYKQAIAACLNHQNLVGQLFDKDNESSGFVKHVMIVPYNRILQWHFVSSVLGGVHPDKAIAICRDGKYDVVVLSSNYRPGEIEFQPKPVRKYLEEFGMPWVTGRAAAIVQAG